MATDLNKQLTGFSSDWWDGVDALRRFLIDRYSREKSNHENYSVNRHARELADLALKTDTPEFAEATRRYQAAKEKMAELERTYDDIMRFNYRQEFETYANKRKADKAELK